jgi:hypothetical protein
MRAPARIIEIAIIPTGKLFFVPGSEGVILLVSVIIQLCLKDFLYKNNNF